MRRRKLAIWLVLAGCAVAAGLWISARRQPRLNVLLITLDTTRADRIGCYGAANAQTPAVDALAERGIVFERAYAPAPLTLPSHVTMLTGLLPPEHGVRLNGTYRLDESIPTLTERLAADGYHTGAFIAAFVLDRSFGLARGFKVYDDELPRGPAHDEHDHRERPGEEVVSRALSWLERQPDGPFFCWVHLFDPHYPYLQHDDLFGDEFRDRPYDGEIAYVDRQVQRLLDYVRSSGREERTLVIVAGDHGESLGEHQEQTHAYTLYNATLHVPLVFSCPDLWRECRRVAQPVSLADLAPTILECLGKPPLTSATGRSLKAACDGEPLQPLPCYAETLQPFEEAGWSPQFSLVTERWKYIRSPRAELYDLREDPRELTNLAGRNPDQLGALEARLAEWEQRMEPGNAPRAQLSPAAHRTLASLGYAGGHTAANASPGRGGDGGGDAGLADIKDRIAYYNQYIAAVRLLNRGQLEEARSELQTVVADVPDYFKAWYNLGVCLLRLQQFEEAAQAFERAVAIDANPTALVALAKARLSQNRPADALAPLKQAQTLDPQSEEVRFLLQDALRRAANE